VGWGTQQQQQRNCSKPSTWDRRSSLDVCPPPSFPPPHNKPPPPIFLRLPCCFRSCCTRQQESFVSHASASVSLKGHMQARSSRVRKLLQQIQANLRQHGPPPPAVSTSCSKSIFCGGGRGAGGEGSGCCRNNLTAASNLLHPLFALLRRLGLCFRLLPYLPPSRTTAALDVLCAVSVPAIAHEAAGKQAAEPEAAGGGGGR